MKARNAGEAMVKYSGAAYCQDLTLKTWLCRHCRKLAYSELVFVASDLLTGGKGYVALDHTLKTIVVAIRGSTNVRNWIVNLNLNRVNLDVGDGTRGISVHEGFQQYAQAITNKLLPTIALLLNRYNYTLTFTGHSLGGAVATLTSIAIKNEFKLPWSSINLVTFGEPRVGNVKFATWINQHNPNHARVVNDRDMVAHVPDQALGYVHRRREIFISDGNIKPCGIEYLEDPNCSLSRKHLMNIWDHAVYLDVIFGVVC
ncbi:hypothetical protein L0F63_001133 [Massospora cicadina]|nr:hypothetical protein L0F63_001133 [Massospora cicadina]